MLLYLSVFLVMAFTGMMVRSRKEQNFALVLFGLFLILFIGTRFDTGCDFRAYEGRFLNLYRDANLFRFIGQGEIGFHALNLLVHRLALDFMWLNVFGATIYVSCLIRFVRITPEPLLLLALFFPIIIIQLGMSGLRQALAVAFILQAMISFTQVRKIHAALWILLAAQFHQSAYLFLPLALMAGRKFSWIMAVLALLVLGPASVFLLGERADVYSNRYVEQIYGENSSGGAVLRYVLGLIPCVIFEFRKRSILEQMPKLYPLLRIISLVTISLAPIGMLSTVALHRMTYYVMPCAMLIFVCALMVLPKTNIPSRQMLGIPVAVLLIYMLGWFTLSRHSSICYVPYETFLF